tara:strand:- start:498 stop:719 length:222 start_codon:yes stop_codon:yes gene_type:complete
MSFELKTANEFGSISFTNLALFLINKLEFKGRYFISYIFPKVDILAQMIKKIILNQFKDRSLFKKIINNKINS